MFKGRSGWASRVGVRFVASYRLTEVLAVFCSFALLCFAVQVARPALAASPHPECTETSTHGCCGDTSYNKGNQGCCDGTTYNLRTQGCCAGVIYNSLVRTCENGTVVQPPPELACTETDTQGCCDGTPYNKLNLGCCDGSTYNLLTQGCCDGTIYNALTRCCTDGAVGNCPATPRPTVVPPRAPHQPQLPVCTETDTQGCCDGTPYNKDNLGCCDGTTYNLLTQGC